MPPHTPRSDARAASVTPSFTFGLGLLPSFRFASPRNLALLSSISPHRFFNRFSKKEEKPKAEESNNHDDIFADFSPETDNQFMESLNSIEDKKFEIDTSDLMNTADSVDLWSLANDTHNQSMSVNLTSISEESKKKEFFLSPNALFLKPPKTLQTLLQSSPICDEGAKTPTTPISRKRKCDDLNSQSEEDESPSQQIASQIESLNSPHSNSLHDFTNPDYSTIKIWNADLDDVLLDCYKKYKVFKENQPIDVSRHKPSLQNKILSRMLHNKTGVRRTAKQVSSRLFRLNRMGSVLSTRSGKSETSPSFRTPGSAPVITINSNFLSSPAEATPEHQIYDASDKLSIDEFSLSFIYKQRIQGRHIFTALDHKVRNPVQMSQTDAKKLLTLDSKAFAYDFEKLSGKLREQNVQMHSVFSEVDFNTSEAVTSTPTSPLTNPRLFCLENGNFLSFLKIKVPSDVSEDAFLSWKSSITVYKGDKVLLSSKEIINGYKNEHNFELEVPFLNNFWSGYLTFLSNGSNAYADLKEISIAQVIYSGEDVAHGQIHGYFTFRFILAENQGKSHVNIITLDDEEDLDENATVLATSSPTKASPQKTGLCINTDIANRHQNPGPMSVPTYNASVLHKVNPNYEANRPHLLDIETKRPPLHFSKSNNNIYHGSQYHTPPITAGEGPQSAPLINAHQSAGQIIANMVPGHEFHSMPASQFHPARPMQAEFSQMGSQHYAPGMAPEMYQPQYQMIPEHTTVESMPMQMKYAPVMNPIVPEQVQGGEMGAQQPWPVMYHPPVPMNYQQPMGAVSSAPASQLHFFPQQMRENDNKNSITFGPIIGYDPSKDIKAHAKRSKTGMNIHKFPLNPQIMYKPRKK